MCALHKFHRSANQGSPYTRFDLFSEFIFSKVRLNKRIVCFPAARRFGILLCRSWFVSRDPAHAVIFAAWAAHDFSIKLLASVGMKSRNLDAYKKQNKSESNDGRGRERAKEGTNFVALLGFFSL
jgi:hypothetical protein